MTISGLCKLTVIADKGATVQSTVVAKTCSSLISAVQSTNYPIGTHGNVMTWNVAKRLADRLFVMIGQSDVLRFYGTKKRKKKMYLGHRGLSGTKTTRR